MNIYEAYLIGDTPLYTPLIFVGLITLGISVASFITMFVSQSSGEIMFFQANCYAAMVCILISICFTFQFHQLEPKALAAEYAENNLTSIEKLTIEKYLLTYRVLKDGKPESERIEVPAYVIERMKNPTDKNAPLNMLATVWLASTLIPAGLLTIVFIISSAVQVYKDYRAEITYRLGSRRKP